MSLSGWIVGNLHLNAALSHERTDFVRSVASYITDHKQELNVSMVLHFQPRLFHLRQFGNTRFAPGRKEIHYNDATGESLLRDRSAIQTLQGKFWRCNRLDAIAQLRNFSRQKSHADPEANGGERNQAEFSPTPIPV